MEACNVQLVGKKVLNKTKNNLPVASILTQFKAYPKNYNFSVSKQQMLVTENLINMESKQAIMPTRYVTNVNTKLNFLNLSSLFICVAMLFVFVSTGIKIHQRNKQSQTKR